MNPDEYFKVWEIKVMKRKAGSEKAMKMLEKVAKHVQPIMRKHKWRVKLLSEFWYDFNFDFDFDFDFDFEGMAKELIPIKRSDETFNGGLNYGAGVHVNLRLRISNQDGDLNFYPFHQVLDTMLHELCHNVYYHHNASFYELWDELRKEYKELMAKGITGTAEGEEDFDLPGRRLGGDSVIMTALSSVQAAAMAAEQRLQDGIWFGLDHVVDYEVAENIVHKLKNVGSSRLTDNSALPSNLLSRKRSLSVNSASSPPNFVDLTMDTPKIKSVMEHQTGSKRRCSGSNLHAGYSSTSVSRPPSGDNRTLHSEESGMWECMICTLLNKSLDPICKVCDTHQPKDVGTTWSCKFCTLENNVKLDKCSACDQWRYSNGSAV